MSSTRSVFHSATTSAPIERVAAMVSDADSWSRWARPLILRSRLESAGEPQADGAGSIRALGLAPVRIRELVTSWDPRHGQTYTILSPRVFDSYTGTIRFEQVPDGGTLIEWSARFTPRLPGAGRALAAAMSLAIGALLGRLVSACDRDPVGITWTVRR